MLKGQEGATGLGVITSTLPFLNVELNFKTNKYEKI
jgi:hypothetical protein